MRTHAKHIDTQTQLHLPASRTMPNVKSRKYFIISTNLFFYTKLIKWKRFFSLFVFFSVGFGKERMNKENLSRTTKQTLNVDCEIENDRTIWWFQIKCLFYILCMSLKRRMHSVQPNKCFCITCIYKWLILIGPNNIVFQCLTLFLSFALSLCIEWSIETILRGYFFFYSDYWSLRVRNSLTGMGYFWLLHVAPHSKFEIGKNRIIEKKIQRNIFLNVFFFYFSGGQKFVWRVHFFEEVFDWKKKDWRACNKEDGINEQMLWNYTLQMYS